MAGNRGGTPRPPPPPPDTRALRDWLLQSRDRILSRGLLESTATPIVETLPVERVTQEKWYYCAPASVEMILALFSVPRRQGDIWDACRPLMVEPTLWYTDP